MTERSTPLSRGAGGLTARLPRALAGDVSQATWLTLAALVGIVVFGGALRLGQNNWDRNGHLHPDERFLTTVVLDTKAPGGVLEYFDTDGSPLNPYNAKDGAGNRNHPSYVYGDLPLFLGKFVAANASTLSFGVLEGEWHTYERVTQIGRALSALLDTATIVFVFLIARRLAGTRAALVAAFLYAFAALPIQHAHFFVVDPFATFFATAAIYGAVRLAQEGGWKVAAWAGVAVGLAMASKITMLALLPVVMLAGVLHYTGVIGDLRARRFANGQDVTTGLALTVLGLWAAAGLGALLAFRITMPYAFAAPSLDNLLGWFYQIDDRWLKDQQAQYKLLDGGGFPPNIQWIGRSPLVWPLSQMVLWGMGPAFGIVAWAGLLWAAGRVLLRREWIWLVLIAWVAGYFLFMGRQFSLYMRYFLPLYPALAVLAALLLVDLVRGSRDLRLPARLRAPAWTPAAARWGSLGLLGTVLLFTFGWGLGYYSIYTRPITRLEATRWIHANIPAGSTIGVEVWDDALPGPGPNQYQPVEFGNYEPDTTEKVNRLLANLDRAQYITLSSQRLLDSVQRVPVSYPVTNRYYDALFSGDLGFRLVKEFTSYPRPFGITVNDRAAEESWSVYDHPPVYIFEKTPAYSRQRTQEVLNVARSGDGVVIGIEPKYAATNGLVMTPEQAAIQRAGGTFSQIFNPDSIANRMPVLVWLFVVEILALALLPAAVVFFRGLPDRGYLLTKPLGLVIFAYLIWGPVGFGLLRYTRTTAIAALALLLVAAIVTATIWERDLRAFLREQWRRVLLGEAIFLGAFAVALGVRLANPDLWHPWRGGEKPLDLSYITAITRTTILPPYDPWMGDGYINYYYYGHFIVSTLMKLTGILPEYAYNLALPTFFALACAVLWSTGYNLAEVTRRARSRPGRSFAPAWSSYWAGGLAVFLVMVSGNVRGAWRAVRDLAKASPYHSDLPGPPALTTAVDAVGGLARRLTGKEVPYDYFDPSRAINLDAEKLDLVKPITEFPAFTFLYADLHAHLMAIPLVLLAFAVCFAAVLSVRELWGRGLGWRYGGFAVFAALLGLLLGTIRWVNTWDVASVGLVSVAALLLVPWYARRGWSWRGAGESVAAIALMGVLAIGLFLPASRVFTPPASGFMLAPQTTPFKDYFWHFGFAFTIILILLGVLLYREAGRTRSLRIRGGTPQPAGAVLGFALSLATLVVLLFERSPHPFVELQKKGLLPLFPDPAMVERPQPVIGLALVLLAGLAFLAYRDLRRPRADSAVRVLLWVLLGVAMALSAVVDMITLQGDITRMNTVFKFFLQVWSIFGLAAAYAAWYLFMLARPSLLRRRARPGAAPVRIAKTVADAPAPAAVPAPVATSPPSTLGLRALTVGLALVVLGGSLYPLLAVPAKVKERWEGVDTGTTLDGMAFMREAVFNDFDNMGRIDLVNDYEGFQWMRENVAGSPQVLEGVTPYYRWSARYAIYTGLPSVSGWDWHTIQHRGRFAPLVEGRQRDIKLFYTSADPAVQTYILDKYAPGYVVLGQLERNYFNGPGLQNIYNGLNGRLQKVYETGPGYGNGGTAIFRVLPRPTPTTAGAR